MDPKQSLSLSKPSFLTFQLHWLLSAVQVPDWRNVWPNNIPASHRLSYREFRAAGVITAEPKPSSARPTAQPRFKEGIQTWRSETCGENGPRIYRYAPGKPHRDSFAMTTLPTVYICITRGEDYQILDECMINIQLI